ncbi:unnamed protein product [Rhizophagus irregularis]|nr:unnamed protein product [Rhizophagus irregularis]
MSSELESLKQRITELEVKNDKLEAENAELRKENTEIRDLRIKLSVSELNLSAENVEFRDRLTKVEQKQTLQSALTANDNSSNNSSPSFNSVAVPEAITVPTNFAKRLQSALMANGKPLEEKDMDSFLLEAHKKIVSKNHVTKISETARSRKSDNSDALVSSFHGTSMIEISQHLAQLCDKALIAEEHRLEANQEEILCWYHYGRNFVFQLEALCDKNKIGEKKARGLIYDEVVKQVNILRKKRSQDTGVPLPDITRDAHDSNSSDDSKEVSPNNSLEDVDDYYKMILEDCAKDCKYFDKEDDSTPQSVKETNEWMPDDSDDDGYGGYNEYGERDRGYYCRDGGYERKTSPMMSPIISPPVAINLVEPEGSSNQDRLILNNEIASEDPGTFMFCNDHSGSLVYGKQDSLGFFSSNISRSEHEEITSHFALHSLQSITMASEPLSTTIASEPSTSTSEIQTDTSEPSQLKCMGEDPADTVGNTFINVVGNNIRVIVGVPVTEQPVTGRIGSLTTGISRLQLQDQRLWIRYNDERVSLPENILELLRIMHMRLQSKEMIMKVKRKNMGVILKILKQIVLKMHSKLDIKAQFWKHSTHG